jgi:putative ABC transport system substrate-binding protein
MRNKIVCFFFFAMALALCASVAAQQPKKIFRIGYLSTTGPSRESTRTEAIRLALRELGYIEGQNIAIEHRYAEGKRDRLSGLAVELVHLNVDIIVVVGGALPIQAVMNATKTIPIIMITGGDDPVEAGLIQSLGRPGGNVTGITNLSRELGGKRLALATDTEDPPPLSQREVCMSTSTVRTVCGSSARTDLCGGRSAMTVPTAIDRFKPNRKHQD